ncbi:hypothetical protein [Fluviicola taffensis]|uniref:hypothetical protein n=1 Tax=Fluviicola taffensis TaxID=191579 RepID=UPI003137ADCD
MYKVLPIDLETLMKRVSPNFMKEDALNLETDDVDSVEAIRRLNYFQTNLLLNKKTVMDTAAILSRDNVDFLYDKVGPLATNKKCITGVLVHFADKINGGVHTFHPVFQPVFLSLKQYDACSMTYVYETTHSDKYYHFSGSELVLCIDGEEQQWLLDYGKYTTINHNKDTSKPFSSVITNVDTESQLFPFQLIYTLMDDNQADQVIFKNCMTEFVHDPSIELKHSLLMSSPAINNNGPFFNKYANRSHLCPPCGRFGFTLI